jgi:predicted nucleic acid-binding protein
LSRCYLDTNFLYVHLRSSRAQTPKAIEQWQASVLVEVTVDGGVISALVLDELAYRLILAWLRDDGAQDPLSAYRADTHKTMRAVRTRLSKVWQAVDSLSLEMQPTDRAVVQRAQSLMASPGLAPRDAFHAAHALAAGCPLIASTDTAFERVPNLRRLAPP